MLLQLLLVLVVTVVAVVVIVVARVHVAVLVEHSSRGSQQFYQFEIALCQKCRISNLLFSAK